MLIAIVPDPHYACGEKRKEVYADSPEELVAKVREFIEDNCYGASDVGSTFSVFRDGNIVGDATYNGKFHWRDPAYRTSSMGGDAVILDEGL